METPKRRLTKAELKQLLLDRLLEALYYLFPAGKVVGTTFKIGNVYGDEGKSLVVELSGGKAGVWKDFATDDEKGDILDLWAAVHRLDTRRHYWEIVASIQEWTGILPDLAFQPQPQSQPPGETPGPQASQGPTEQGQTPQPQIPEAQASEPLGETRLGQASLGTLTGKWAYKDVDGNTLAWAYRYDPPKRKKEIRYQDAKTGRWTISCPRPLYNQPGIASSDSVVLVEGEKCAEVLINLGICATTAMNGANAIIDKTDWSPLRGKHVTIWPDHDASGKGYMDRVIPKLQTLELASLSLLEIPDGKPEKWDAADAIDEGMDIKAFMNSCTQAVPPLSDIEARTRPVEELTATPPLPLRKKLEKAKPYPVEALGDLLEGAALDIHDTIQAPLAICAQSVLANAALVTQAHIDIKLPFGQTSPTSLYLLSISESGGRKSTSDKEASLFIKKREEELRKDYQKDLAAYNNAKDAHDALRRNILNNKSHKNQQDLENELNALGPSPTPPLDFVLTVPEPTYEGICLYLGRGQPSLGLFSDEGAQFIFGHGMNADNKIKTAAGLSSLWGGESIKRMRAMDGTVALYGKRLSMHLMVQNGIVDPLISDSELLQQGILSRILVVSPDHLFGTRFSTNKKMRNGSALKEFNDRMLGIARKALPINSENERNELIPRVLEMTPETEAAFYEFSDRIEARLKDGCDLESIRGFCSKLAEQASRIAAVIAFAEDPGIPYLQKCHFDCGATIAEYYALEALRLFGNTAAPSYILAAESLLKWLRDVWPTKTTHPDLVSLPDVCLFGPNKIRRKEPAMNALKTLEDHGWLLKEKNGAVINEKYRKDVWRIRREFFEHTEKQEGTQALATLANFSNSASLKPEEAILPASQPDEPMTGEGRTQTLAALATLAATPSTEKVLGDEEWEGINV